MVEQISSLKTGVKYKDTPIGKVPVDWEVAFLGKIAYLEYGASLPDRNREKGNIPVYGSSGIAGYHSKALIDMPGIIIGRKGTVGSVSWADKNFWCIDTTYYISKKQTKEYLKWLFYLLSNLNFKKLNIATGVPGLNREEAHSILVPIPPYPEQKKIADILSAIDDAIEKTNQIIETTKDLKKGLMQILFTRGIGHKKFKRAIVDKLPVDWEVVKLGDISLKFYNGGTPDTKNKNYWNGEIPWITGADFEDQKVRRIRKYISNDGVVNSATNIVKKGNLLVATRTGVGKLAIAPFDIAISQDITGIVLDQEKAWTKYIYWYFNHNENQLKAIVQGTSINGLLRDDLESIAVSLPPLPEQKKIADILSTIDDQIEKESSPLGQLKMLKKGLMQVLLTGKLRVAV